MTFRGTPRRSDYPSSYFAKDIKIMLRVKNNIGNTVTTDYATLVVYSESSYSIVNKGPPYFASNLVD